MISLFNINIRIAARNIRRHGRRSFLTIFAMAFGIFCLIVFQALKTGLHEKMLESSLGIDLGNIQIHTTGYETNMPLLQILPDPEVIATVLADKNLLNHSALRVKTTALILAKQRSSSVILSGIDPRQEKNVTFIHQKIIAGQYRLADRQILIGKSLADNLELGMGDNVNIIIQNSFGQPVTAKLSIGGIFESGQAMFDRSYIYLAINDARSILETEDDAVTEVAIAVASQETAAMAASLQNALHNRAYRVRTFRELAPDLVQLMELNDATFKLLIIIVFAIVAMGIANTMTTVIFERFRELGTLAAIGATPFEIVLLIITESALLGIFAAVIGSIGAIIACTWLAIHGIDLSHFTSSNQYFAAGSVLKAYLYLNDVIIANSITLMTAIAAGIYPALKAARMKPVKALRYT